MPLRSQGFQIGLLFGGPRCDLDRDRPVLSWPHAPGLEEEAVQPDPGSCRAGLLRRTRRCLSLPFLSFLFLPWWGCDLTFLAVDPEGPHDLLDDMVEPPGRRDAQLVGQR